MLYKTFSNKDRIPAIGLGTWQSENKEVNNAVRYAIDIGYRHIDCAFIYGNEIPIGQAIKESLKSEELSREELWITSKLWNNSHKPEDVIPAIKKSIKDLRVDYLDLYLIHWPVVQKSDVINARNGSDFLPLNDVQIEETWEAMQELKQEGLAKHVGVCNFSIDKLKNFKKSGLPTPEVNQIELHPYLRQEDMLQYAQENQIVITAYSPLGRGLIYQGKTDFPTLLEHEIIKSIAEELQVSPAQVLIRWALERGTAVIPKSVNPKHIKSNLATLNFRLTDEHLQLINQLDRHYRYIDGTFWTGEGSPYTLERLWEE